MADDLVLTNVTKRFGSFVAVDDLSLTVPQGAFFALLGASGCGKTTTLRTVAGLEEPTSGVIRLGDKEITSLRPYKRPVNTVFQSYALFPHMSIKDNVAFGLRQRGVKDVNKKVMEMLELVQLGSFENRKPAQLSGGQQQRVALARALVNEPQVLLLDEPLGALDLKLRRQMQIELKRIQTEVGITFLHVTHDQDEAMWMADTVAVMNAGKIEQLGAPTDIYEFPSSPFVSNFLGQSNLFAAEVAGRSGDDLELTAHGERFAAPASRAHATEGRVWLGVRPEKVRLAEPGQDPPANHNQVRGVLTDTCYAGVSTEYLLKTPWGQEMSVFSANHAAGEPLAPGTEVVALSYPPHSFVLDRPAGSGDEVTQYAADPLGVAP